ncbi:dihydrodipicolinate synthase family protein [Rhodospirillaceae bacterium SYSU D60014]|uniref:dihydrodipicolinate synthase family protein n=1 Tax=Virgifigura deserti TaxID=2268457 RepID=UPI000E6656FA
MTSQDRLRTSTADPLWVPLLTHYSEDGGIDAGRMIAHAESMAHEVRQVMLAGSTGDGWELDDRQFDALIDLGAGDLPAGMTLLFGILRGDTEGVIARLKHLEARLSYLPALRSRFLGVAVCPPVDARADQARIRAHFEAILAESRSPIALYQLPQVTQCRMSPETVAELCRNPRIILFKDSSGEDKVASAGEDYSGTVLLRGAEGGYLEALPPAGPYHGWLLSTGNALSGPLRRILALRAGGQGEEAAALSMRLSSAIGTVFAAAGKEGGANAFSNANRAMDHLRAYGQTWRHHPAARKIDGSTLSPDLVAAAERACGEFLDLSAGGYIAS